MNKPEKAEHVMNTASLSAMAAQGEGFPEMHARLSVDFNGLRSEQIVRLLILDIRRSFLTGNTIEAGRLAQQVLPFLVREKSVSTRSFFKEVAPALAIPVVGAGAEQRILCWLAQRLIRGRSKGLVVHKRTCARRPRMLVYSVAIEVYAALAAGIIHLTPSRSFVNGVGE